jgi:two-component system OmpR family sensor kinase
MSYLFRSADGTIQARSPGADPAVFGDLPRGGFRDHADYRVMGKDLGDGSFLEVADPLAERRDATLDALVTLLVPAALLAPIIFVGVGRIVAARLRPVTRLAEQVALRDSGDLRPLSTPGLQVEMIPIRDAVDRLMGRLSDALAAERSFSANAAHELRTPIAATLAHTQRLITEAPAGALRARAETIEFELKRMARLSEKLLDLSRVEAAGVASGSGEDLRPILSLVVEDFRPIARDLRLTMPSSPVSCAIDPDAFAILARNLIENAILHGLPPVDVTLDRWGRLEVSNDGATLDPASLARLTRRFERLGSRRVGSGLGLAIVEALARNADARLEFLSPATGRSGGLSAVVTLPAFPARPS